MCVRTMELLLNRDNYKVCMFSLKEVLCRIKTHWGQNFKYKVIHPFEMDAEYLLPECSTCLPWQHLYRRIQSLNHVLLYCLKLRIKWGVNCLILILQYNLMFFQITLGLGFEWGRERINLVFFFSLCLIKFIFKWYTKT